MKTDDAIHEQKTAPTEILAFVYELPHFLLAIFLGAVGAFAYRTLVIHYDPALVTRLPMILMIAFALAGLFVVFFAASYYARGVAVFKDRVTINMAFGERDITFDKLVDVKPVPREKMGKKMLSPRCMCLTPALTGALAFQRKKGRPWIVSVPDPDALIEAVKSARSAGAPSADIIDESDDAG